MNVNIVVAFNHFDQSKFSFLDCPSILISFSQEILIRIIFSMVLLSVP